MTLSSFKKIYFLLFIVLIPLAVSSTVQARYESNFSSIGFTPAVDSGDYVTVYGSQNLAKGQGALGIYFDYADRPLQFVATGAATGRQSVIDRTIVADLYGAYGFTDWFSVGLNVPVVAYNWFFTGVDQIGATSASAYNTLVPIFGVFFSWLLLGEHMDASLLVGGGIAVLGLGLMNGLASKWLRKK